MICPGSGDANAVIQVCANHISLGSDVESIAVGSNPIELGAAEDINAAEQIAECCGSCLIRANQIAGQDVAIRAWIGDSHSGLQVRADDVSLRTIAYAIPIGADAVG